MHLYQHSGPLQYWCTGMLQEQQGLLKPIQKQMEEKQAVFEENVLALEHRVCAATQSFDSCSTSCEDKPCKHVVTVIYLACKYCWHLAMGKSVFFSVQNLISLAHSASEVKFDPEDRYIPCVIV